MQPIRKPLYNQEIWGMAKDLKEGVIPDVGIVPVDGWRMFDPQRDDLIAANPESKSQGIFADAPLVEVVSLGDA